MQMHENSHARGYPSCVHKELFSHLPNHITRLPACSSLTIHVSVR